jgi:CheY-like chemotaxis protein
LLVEDDVDGANALKSYLEFRGFAVTWVRSGEEALSALAEQQVSVVVTDVKLPGMSGDALARVLAAAQAGEPGYNTQVIALSGEAHKALAASFKYWLAKPCRPSRLVALIDEITA